MVAQWLRNCLPMQGTWVRSLVQEDPTCRRATKPVCHNYWARALEHASHNFWAPVPQLLKPARLEPMLHNKWSHGNEKPAHHNKEQPPLGLVHDGGVEGRALTPSCESTGITTNCWPIIDRKTLELTKKDTSHPKTKEKPQWDGKRGSVTIKENPITAGWVTQTREHLYHKSPPTAVKVLSPMSGSPTWGSGNRMRNS